MNRSPASVLPAWHDPAKEALTAGLRTRARRSIQTIFAAIAILSVFAAPVLSQTADAPMPENAHEKSYGDGWECDISYRRDSDACVAVVIPLNAFATNRTYGSAWECKHGFRKVDGLSCSKVFVPDGGYLDASGERWNCHRGFQKVDDSCQKIVLPENAFLANSSRGQGWVCNRGFEANGEACSPIDVPDHAFLTPSSYGKQWTCERGFFEGDGRCNAVIIPDNAYFDDASYGPGWKCDRGYTESENGCTVINLPENAHLDRSGNRWECHKNFQRYAGKCILN